MSFLSAADESVIDDYAGVMHYSIGKFEQAIGIGQRKETGKQQPLPQIGSTRSRSRASMRERGEQNLRLPPNRAYKRLRRVIKGIDHNSVLLNHDSTALDSSVRERPSLSVVNKPIRMLSFVEKNVRVQYQTNIPPTGYKLDFPSSMKELDPADYW